MRRQRTSGPELTGRLSLTSKQARERREQFIAAAREQIGYRAAPNLASEFGHRAGHGNQTWDGSFLEFCARAAHVDLPALSSTASALAYFIAKRRIFRVPRPGDIVFYAFSTEDGNGFGQPHCGLITTVRPDGSFLAIEGQTSPGPASPRANPTPNGVFERERFRTDVLAFARPRFRDTEKGGRNMKDVKTWVRTGHFAYRKSHKSVALVQTALGVQHARRGVFDGPTKSAYAEYQRQQGLVGRAASGQPDTETLTKLGTSTGLFTVRP